MKGNNLVHCALHLLGVHKATTQTTSNEQRAMRKYLKGAKLIGEIGVFEGYNTREFAKNSPKDARVYAIDPFFKGALGFSYGKIIARREWRRCKLQEKIVVVEGLSWDSHNSIPDNLDFLFIDGDHSFEGVARDFESYKSKIGKDGIIAFHDARTFDRGWTTSEWGPVKFVDSVIRTNKEWEIVEETDSIVLIRKAA